MCTPSVIGHSKGFSILEVFHIKITNVTMNVAFKYLLAAAAHSFVCMEVDYMYLFKIVKVYINNVFIHTPFYS